jgi:uncharacterized protein (TIGR02145 family)
MGNVVFPASGYRHHMGGNMLYVGEYGCYWSGSEYGDECSYEMWFSISGMSTDYFKDRRVYGLSVRCVMK